MVSPARVRALAATVTLAALCAVAAVLVSAHRDDDAAAASAEFQSLVFGLGAAPVLDLSECGRAFDPRVSFECRDHAGPVPGGASFCPHLGALR